jgi:hypothetical protein
MLLKIISLHAGDIAVYHLRSFLMAFGRSTVLALSVNVRTAMCNTEAFGLRGYRRILFAR